VATFPAGLRAKAEQLPVQFDWTILVPILVQVLMDMIGNCGVTAEQKLARAKQLASDPNNFWTKRAARQAVQKASCECSAGIKGKDARLVESALLSQLGSCTPEDIEGIMSEVEQAADYGLL